ncbi:ROP protein [Verticillium dahliae VdLs.17]|uniref:ROP protein n=1 Tax=Verticillium dahliae (strain VdLs.17 / ATCC MYA-4575 / FGSC 10137) TaxID=498257 RepID=G2XIY3_VERDV|nr:ROP protein [Verticillium dahliae VdLs.17]EGY20486.1 ROP protein [Verticillium dahliae VdLs.17]
MGGPSIIQEQRDLLLSTIKNITRGDLTGRFQILGVCVTLGEYPRVRYYKPANAMHEASVLCEHLARMVQEELDTYANWNQDYPPQTNRPASTLIITDRSMDITAPLVHEFTYQAMAHDLLPIREGEKIMYHTVTDKGTPDEAEIDYEITDKDKVWTDYRHQHMKDTIGRMTVDFKKFLEANPAFVNEQTGPGSVNNLRDMLGGMKEFAAQKESFSLHMSMAQDAMNLFEQYKLPDVASVEQSLATGMDEDNRRPKNILESVVRLLDDQAITPSDRLRLIILYILYREGVIENDIFLLLEHAKLPKDEAVVVKNLAHLGGRVLHNLKEARRAHPPAFPKNTKPPEVNEEYALSRFEPALQSVLEDVVRGTLSSDLFPYMKPPMDPNEDLIAAQQGSLRAGRPNWAASGRKAPENRQRVIVFLAGGATFSESRVCYDIGAARSRDIFLATSHMLSPNLFIRQLRDLDKGRGRLDLPADRPKPRAPDWIHERPALHPSCSSSSSRWRGAWPPRPSVRAARRRSAAWPQTASARRGPARPTAGAAHGADEQHVARRPRAPAAAHGQPQQRQPPVAISIAGARPCRQAGEGEEEAQLPGHEEVVQRLERRRRQRGPPR